MYLIYREAASSNERAETELKSVTANESAYYTLFVLNSLYLVSCLLHLLSYLRILRLFYLMGVWYRSPDQEDCNCKAYHFSSLWILTLLRFTQAVFLLTLRYVLPAQELSERVNYALASSGAAAVTAFAVALKVV